MGERSQIHIFWSIHITAGCTGRYCCLHQSRIGITIEHQFTLPARGKDHRPYDEGAKKREWSPSVWWCGKSFFTSYSDSTPRKVPYATTHGSRSRSLLTYLQLLLYRCNNNYSSPALVPINPSKDVVVIIIIIICNHQQPKFKWNVVRCSSMEELCFSLLYIWSIRPPSLSLASIEFMFTI